MEYRVQIFRSLRDMESLNKILHEDNKPIQYISAIRSCIEADEARYLLKILNNNIKAMIYSLISCFTFIPSLKCIEYLIAEGTPLNETFENNPFKCTPQEYLDMRFPDYNVIGGQQYNCISRDAIYDAIERGKLARKIHRDKKIRRTITSLLRPNDKA